MVFLVKSYIVIVQKSEEGSIVIVKDKNKKIVKRVLFEEWDSRKEYYENLYGFVLLLLFVLLIIEKWIEVVGVKNFGI